MTEFILNTKILREAEQTLTAQTGDNSWIFILFFVAIIAGIVVFKKKFVKVLLSFVLVFSFVVFTPKESYASQKVSITSTAELSEGNPAQLTITNNDDYAININSLEISNQALPVDTTWNISIKDNYIIDEAEQHEDISFDIAPHSAFTFSVYPNTDEIPSGELCDICFKAVSTHYSARYINDDDKELYVDTKNDFDFSFSTFENSDNTKLNREVASVEAAFASIPNTYNNIILDNVSYDIRDRISFMRTLGFEDNIYCKLFPDDQPQFQADPGVSISTPTYNLDKNDVTSFCFNHKKINFGNHYSEIINISVGATGGSFEWASNFDFGASEDTDYWKATGDHPEWENFENHKGFDIARYRLMYAYNSYFSKYIDADPNVDKIILINGHSRGGAIANLLGHDFEDNPEYKPFTYTFASPNTASFSLNNADNTIFNITNRDDLVSQFPGYISGFYKYGQDVELSVFEDNSISGTLMKTIFKDKSGYGEYNGNDPDDVEALIIAACDLIENREDAYTLAAASSKVYTKLDGSYETQKDADDALNAFKVHLQNNNLNYYADPFVEHDEFTGYYVIKFKCCAAFIMQDISNWIFLNGGDTDKYKPSIGYNDTLINVLLVALGVVPGIVHSHVWMSYNLLATYDKY